MGLSLISQKPYMVILLVLFLIPLGIKAAEYDYYSSNPGAQKGMNTVIKHHWSQANHAVNILHYKTGMEELDFILRWIPNHPRALLLLSKLTTAFDRALEADKYFEEAIKFGPQYVGSYGVYGIHLYKSGRFKESIKKFNSALAINSESSEIHYNIGLTYFEIGDHKNANIHAQKAYKLEYPLPGLKNKLKSINKWDTSISSKME